MWKQNKTISLAKHLTKLPETSKLLSAHTGVWKDMSATVNAHHYGMNQTQMSNCSFSTKKFLTEYWWTAVQWRHMRNDQYSPCKAAMLLISTAASWTSWNYSCYLGEPNVWVGTLAEGMCRVTSHHALHQRNVVEFNALTAMKLFAKGIAPRQQHFLQRNSWQNKQRSAQVCSTVTTMGTHYPLLTSVAN